MGGGGGGGEGHMNVGQQIKTEMRRCCTTIHWTLWVTVACVCVEHLQNEFSSTHLKVSLENLLNAIKYDDIVMEL